MCLTTNIYGLFVCDEFVSGLLGDSIHLGAKRRMVSDMNLEKRSSAMSGFDIGQLPLIQPNLER